MADPIARGVPPTPAQVERVGRWFDEHVDAVHRYASRRLGEDLGRDVVSETFRVALARVAEFDETKGTERAWLFGIATNIIRRHHRTEQRLLQNQVRTYLREPAPTDPITQVDDDVDAVMRWQRLARAVDELSDDDRDLLVLTAWEELSSVEVAAALGIPPGTVRSRLHRIRAALAASERSHHG
jgi:RNA polymerase sigma factor (sigma-70 family)